MVIGRGREGDSKGSGNDGSRPGTEGKQVPADVRHSGPQRTSEHAPDSEKGRQESRPSGRMRR